MSTRKRKCPLDTDELEQSIHRIMKAAEDDLMSLDRVLRRDVGSWRVDEIVGDTEAIADGLQSHLVEMEANLREHHSLEKAMAQQVRDTAERACKKLKSVDETLDRILDTLDADSDVVHMYRTLVTHASLEASEAATMLETLSGESETISLSET